MKITVAGGDGRMKTLRTLFAKNGFDCSIEEARTKAELLAEISVSDAVILPTPCSKNGFLNAPFMKDKTPIGEIFHAGNGKTLFLGGSIGMTGENLIDYSLCEEYLIKNAVLTAEGAVETAMQETDIALYGSSILVVGFGRIGGYLAKILKDFGANTVVAARSEKSRANAEISGHKAVSTDGMSDVLPFADIVFNTVPSVLFGEKELSRLRRDSLLIDLASLPGGVDTEAAERLGVNTIHALGLPGKYSPEAAGRIIFETVMRIFGERGLSA